MNNHFIVLAGADVFVFAILAYFMRGTNRFLAISAAVMVMCWMVAEIQLARGC